jgi:hypothetical protein
VIRVTAKQERGKHAEDTPDAAWWGRRAEMRQWVSVFVLLFFVMLVATFVVSSIVTMVEATVELQRAIADIDDLTYADSMDECDPFDSSPCF